MAAKKRSSDKVPDGFREVDTSLAGFWKPETVGQSFQGIVGAMIETKGVEDKPNRFYSVRVSDAAKCQSVQSADGERIDVEGGDLVGVGGAILLAFLTGREGKEVYLVYKGLGAKKKGKNQARLYATYARDFDPATGEVVDD